MKSFHGWLPYNFVSFHFNCEWFKEMFLLFSGLFYDIKFLLVHTLCEWFITYPLGSFLFLFDDQTGPTFEHQKR